ncbi:MAG: N-acetyl-gamma-glutamyl-phosphate reductase, partial [Cyclobacteriaceae bacterium]
HEIRQTLTDLQPGFKEQIHFVPWRGDFTRGIFVTSVVTVKSSGAEILNLYKSYYQDHPFTIISENPVDMKQVVNTNKCLIQIEQQDHTLAVHSVIDNLLKGAAGQAVQNMNLIFDFPETAGLNLKPTAY